MTQPTIRPAVRADLEAIVALLANDPLGSGREVPSLPLDARYVAGFDAIASDPNQLLLVADADGSVVGTLQLTFIPGVARLGVWRAQIEAVRVAEGERNSGLGRRMFEHAIAEARRRGAGLVQLTTDKTRPDAHRFYESLGFEGSHIGYKLKL